MPYALLLGQLRYTHQKLRALPTTAPYTAAAQKLLRERLAATITDLNELYADRRTSMQRYQLLRPFELLQHRLMALKPGRAVPFRLCLDVHQALLTTIEASLDARPILE